MAKQNTEKQCAHPGCECPVPQGETWCSPHCEAAPTEAICGCGHAACVAGAYLERTQTARQGPTP